MFPAGTWVDHKTHQYVSGGDGFLGLPQPPVGFEPTTSQLLSGWLGALPTKLYVKALNLICTLALDSCLGMHGNNSRNLEIPGGCM